MGRLGSGGDNPAGNLYSTNRDNFLEYSYPLKIVSSKNFRHK